MADDANPQPPLSLWGKVWAVAKAVAGNPAVRQAFWALLAALLAALSTAFGLHFLGLAFVPPAEVNVYVPATDTGAYPCGWVRDEDAISRNLDPAKTLQFADTPAGRAALGDDDVFLWRAVRKAAGKPAEGNWYPNIDQGPVGSCVGAGWKHSADVVQGTAIVLGGQRFEWKPVSAECIYAGSRVEVGGGRIGGDGSVGEWAMQWVSRRGGLIAMQNYPGVADLSAYSASRARSWGRTGVPDALEADAKLHPVKGCSLVTSAADARRAIAQGYPVAVCSNQGFTMTRDANGFCRASGSWPHCMSIIGVRSAPRPGFFILNSWGDNAHTGPAWPADMPVAGFWAEDAVVDRMLKQNDSFALSDVSGFPRRVVPLNWDVRLPRAKPLDLFALRSESALAW